MSASARCGQCGTTYASVPAKFAGKSIRCKKCGASVKVPGPAAGKADRSDVGDDLEAEAPAAPSPRSTPERPAAAKTRKPGGIPKWVWFVGGGAGVCLLGCAGLLVALATTFPAKARESVLRDQQAVADDAAVLMEDLAATLGNVSDAASARAAAETIRGPLMRRIDAIAPRVTRLNQQRAKLPVSQKEPLEAGEREIKAKLDARMNKTIADMKATAPGMAGVPPDARQELNAALLMFGDRLEHVYPAVARQDSGLLR